MIEQKKACLIEKCHVHILESFVSKLYHDSKAQEEAKQGFSLGSESENTEPILIILLLVSALGLNNLITIFEENKKSVKIAKLKKISFLHFACIGGYIEENCKRNVFGESGHDTTNEGQHYMSRSRGHLQMIDELITEYHLDPNAKNEAGNTPLHVTALYGQVDKARLLITEYQVETDARNNDDITPLCLASQAGQFNLVKMLIEEFECCPSTQGFREQTLLHFACQSENFELIDSLIRDYKLSPMCKDTHGNTPLHIAALFGQVETVRHLITEYKVETDARNIDNDSAVCLASRIGRFSLVKMLIEEFECCPFTLGFRDRTLLHCACQSRNLELIDLLIRDYKLSPMCKDTGSNTPLHIAAVYGQVETVRHLITEYKVETDARNIDNASAVCLASQKGLFNLVKMLIEEFNCSTLTQGLRDRTLLHCACHNENLELIDLLIKDYKLSPMCKDTHGNTPLHIAAVCGQAEAVRHLITEYKVETDARNIDNDSAVCLASKTGRFSLVKMLIEEFECCPFTLGFREQTLLHCACQSGKVELIDLLIRDYKLSPMCKDTGSNTPLHIAALCGQVETVRHLITEYKVETDARNIDNDSAVCLASRTGRFNSVKMLIEEFSCYPSTQGFREQTLLHCACQSENLELIDLLIRNYKLSPMCKDTDGNTPLHIAAFYGQFETARHLITEYKVETDARNIDNDSPVCLASQAGQFNLVKMLIEEFECCSSTKGFNEQTLLHFAGQSRNLKLIDSLIRDYKLSPMCKDSDGNSPLHFAAACGQVETMRYLITEYKVDFDAPNWNCLTPLGIAVVENEIQVVHALLEEFNCNLLKCGLTVSKILNFACKNGHKQLIDTLITRYHIDPMTRDDDGNTMLHLASMFGQVQIVKHLVLIYKLENYDTHQNKINLTPLCLAAKNGHYDVLKALLTDFKCSPNVRGYNGFTLLHFASQGGQVKLIDQIIAKYNFDPNAKDDDGNTPLHIAAMCGQIKTIKHLLSNKMSSIDVYNSKQSTPVFVAAQKRQEESVQFMINQFQCIIHTRDYNGRTMLHYACEWGNAELAEKLLQDTRLDQNIKDNDGNTALQLAVMNGHALTITLLLQQQNIELQGIINSLELAALRGHHGIFKLIVQNFNWDSTSLHYNGRSVLHCACIGGNPKLITELITEYKVGTVMTVVDDDGNTPLHVSTMHKNVSCVEILLHELKAPLFVRNKLGMTAYDIARAKQIQPIVKILQEYLQNNSSQVQSTYGQLERLAKKEFAGKKPLTRVFVVGHPEVGKSTLIDTLKKESRLSLEYLLGFGKSTVSPHTAGIVPSIYDTEKYGRVIFYDFAGDREYYSSHAAILENIDTSKGVNLYLVVCDLTNDDELISKGYGYWLSFLTYSLQDSEAESIIAPIGSHADRLSQEIVNAKLSVLDNISQKFFSLNSLYTSKPCVALDCRERGSSIVNQIKQLCREISLSVPPVKLSFETSILLGLLLKDFSNVIICSVGTVIEHIEQTGIPLPTSPSLLYSLIKELHNLGLLLAIERKGSPIEHHLIILKIAVLTSDVHRSLFSKSGKAELAKHTDELKLSVGIIPESLLDKVLPEYITKECLIKLQYCQEIESLIVEKDHTFTQSDTVSSTQLALEHKSLLFFPALCELKLEDIQWPSVTDKGCSLGWYAKCTENRFDYFPTRFLHVLIVRLSLKFALKQNLSAANSTASGTPSALEPTKNDSTLAELHAFNPRCHVWATGLHWLMENGVEVFVDMPKEAESKELVVVGRSSNSYRAECANTLQKVVQTVIEAKVEFCHSILPSVYLLDPVRLKGEPFTNAKNVPLYTLSDVERALEEGSNVAVSVDGHHSTPPKDLTTLSKWTMSYWSKLMQ